jgi:ssDNA-binding Zn-finger/Zn-ribbon topoisomerase 1
MARQILSPAQLRRAMSERVPDFVPVDPTNRLDSLRCPICQKTWKPRGTGVRMVICPPCGDPRDAA